MSEAAATGVWGKLREIQCICKEGGEPVATTVVEVMDLARDVVGAKCDHATLVKTQVATLEELNSLQAVKRLVRKDLETSNAQLTTLHARLDEVSTSPAKANETAAKVESDSQLRHTLLERLLDKERDHYKRMVEDYIKRVATTQATLDAEISEHAESCKQ